MRRLLDTNTWIALTVETHPQNARPRQWYDAAPLVAGDLLFCRATEISYLRLITQEGVMKQCGIIALTNEEAASFLEDVYRDPGVSCVDEPPATRSLWLQMSTRQSASPNLWMDAYLAAFAVALGAELVTFDRGFSEFEKHGLQLCLLQTP